MSAAWAWKPWKPDDTPIMKPWEVPIDPLSGDVAGGKSQSKRPRDEEVPGIDPVDPTRKRLKGQITDKGPMTDSGGQGNTTAPMAMRATGGSSDGRKGAHETPVLYHAPTYGLPETHTTTLPITYYFGAGGYDKGTPLIFKVLMTSPYSSFPTSLVTKAGGAAIDKNLVTNIMAYGSGSTHTDPATFSFPAVATATPIPAWRSYWERLYEVYHVTECHWKLTAINANGADSEAGAALIGHGYDSYGASSTENVFPSGATLDETFSWKDISYDIVHGWNNDQATSRSTTVISGSYRPGQQKHNVTNDEDIKTWTAVGSAPSFTEQLNLMFWQAPMATAALNTNKMNCMLQVKWVVQFKDLRRNARYPTISNAPSAITSVLPTDALVTH